MNPAEGIASFLDGGHDTALHFGTGGRFEAVVGVGQTLVSILTDGLFDLGDNDVGIVFDVGIDLLGGFVDIHHGSYFLSVGTLCSLSMV